MNIYLDSKFYPYLSEFYYAKQIEVKYPYVLIDSTPGFMAPEFIDDYKSNQNSFSLDVYAFGMTLFILITENNPFAYQKPKDILAKIKSGNRPQFPQNINKNWMKLINKCWKQNPEERPSFEEICNVLESKEFVNEYIDQKSFESYKKLIKKQDKNL